MKKNKSIINYIKKPYKILIYLAKKNKIYIRDDYFLKLQYKDIIGKKLNLENPKTFNEKLQWLKLNDRKDIYTTMVDKYEVKDYVANIIGKEYVIPTLGIYDKFEDINFENLPNQFVMKCTHDSGSTIVCKDKSKLNIKQIKNKLNKCLKKNFYYEGREWPYKNVKPRIIIEEYMEDSVEKELRDYKFYCFDGKVDYCMLCLERNLGKPKFLYFDREWKLKKEMSYDGQNKENDIDYRKPDKIEKMFQMASYLSKGMKFVRIDMYNVNGKIYFGEYTFYPSSGLDGRRTEYAQNYLDDNLKIDLNRGN